MFIHLIVLYERLITEKNKMEDNAKYPLLNIKNKFDRVVIIGGGFNAIEHKEAIKVFH